MIMPRTKDKKEQAKMQAELEAKLIAFSEAADRGDKYPS